MEQTGDMIKCKKEHGYRFYGPRGGCVLNWWRKLDSKNKTVVILAVLLLILVFLGKWRNLRQGIFIGDEFLVQKSSEDFKSGNSEIHMYKTDESTNFDVVMNGVTKKAELLWKEPGLAENIW